MEKNTTSNYCYWSLLYLFVFSYAAPDEAPTNLTDIKVTADSIQISWQPVPQESLNGKLCAYEICWKEEKAENYSCQQLAIKDPIACRAVINDHAPTDFILRNLTNFTLRNLTVYTNYSVEIAAHTGAKEGLAHIVRPILCQAKEVSGCQSKPYLVNYFPSIRSIFLGYTPYSKIAVI